MVSPGNLWRAGSVGLSTFVWLSALARGNASSAEATTGRHPPLGWAVRTTSLEVRSASAAGPYALVAGDDGLVVLDQASGQTLDALRVSGHTLAIDAQTVRPDYEPPTVHLGMGGRFAGTLRFPGTPFCASADWNHGLSTVQCSSNGATSIDTYLVHNTNATASDNTVDGGSTAAYLALAKADPSGYEGLDYEWATIPWSGTYDASVDGVAVDPTPGFPPAVVAAGITRDGASSSAWVGRFVGGPADWTRQFPGYDTVHGLDLDGTIVCFRADHSRKGQQMIACLDATDGSLIWARHTTLEDSSADSHRGGLGTLRMAQPEDGPYVYAEFTASRAAAAAAAASPETFDRATSYAACLDGDDKKIPSYEVVTDKLLTEADCLDRGYTAFLPPASAEGIPPGEVPTGVACPTAPLGRVSCIARFHKFTGRPQWAVAVAETRGMETSPEGPVLVGPFGSRNHHGLFGTAAVPDIGNRTGAFQTLLDKATGAQRHVRFFGDENHHIVPNTAAMDDRGNFYLVAHTNVTSLRVSNEEYQLVVPTSIDQDGDGQQTMVLQILSAVVNDPEEEEEEKATDASNSNNMILGVIVGVLAGCAGSLGALAYRKHSSRSAANELDGNEPTANPSLGVLDAKQGIENDESTEKGTQSNASEPPSEA